MKIRTFLVVLLSLLLGAAAVFVLLPNAELLEERLWIGTRSVPVWGALLAAFVLGIVVELVFRVTGAGRGSLRRARGLVSGRRGRSVQRALEAGAQAEREGRIEEAIAAYREAVGRAAGDFRAHMRLGDALRRAGRPLEAARAHERARRIDPGSDEPGHALVLDYLAADRVGEARRELVEIIERNPRGAIGPVRQLRDLEIRAGRWEEAADAARRLESLADPTHPLTEEDVLQGLGIRTEQARARAAAGQVRAATGILRKVLRERPGFLPAIVLLAELRERAGETERAREVLVEGYRETGEVALLERLVELDLRRERPEDAISTLRGLAADPSHAAGARYVLAGLYLRLEMPDEAKDQLDRVLDTREMDELVAHLLARAEEKRGRCDRAAELYRWILQRPGRAIPAARCAQCDAELAAWTARCPACGVFGAVHSRVGHEEPAATTPPPADTPLYPA